jgi:O-antigen ligase
LANQYAEQNTHNVFLQVLNDAGVIGAGLILAFITRVIFIAKDKMITILAVIVILSSSLVDYFIDHSVPWVIVVAYFYTWYWHITKNLKSKDLDNET